MTRVTNSLVYSLDSFPCGTGENYNFPYKLFRLHVSMLCTANYVISLFCGTRSFITPYKCTANYVVSLFVVPGSLSLLPLLLDKVFTPEL